MAQVLPVAVEHLARFEVVLVGTQAFQRTVGQLATTHAVFGALDQLQDARIGWFNERVAIRPIR